MVSAIGSLTRAGFPCGLSVNSFAWRPASDFDGKILYTGQAVTGARHQGVREEFLVVALGKISALVCAAGLLALQGGVRDGFGVFRHYGELEWCDRLSVVLVDEVRQTNNCTAVLGRVHAACSAY